ncbi:MAG: PQQ-binding-like beta-propeller repeat protein [Verrucomicrobiota bacterium]
MIRTILLLAYLLTSQLNIMAADWPQFRGINRDGHSADVPEKWSDPALVWKKKIAQSIEPEKKYGGIVVQGKHVVVTDHDQAKDYLLCFDKASGDVIWKYEVPNGKEMDFGASPRAIPLIHDSKVFFLTAWGDLHALELSSGKKIWNLSYVEDFGGELPDWGFCGSPLLVDGKLIITPGGKEGLVALDLADGADIWIAETLKTNYSSFMAYKIGNMQQVVGYDDKTLRGWDVKTGKELWKLPIHSPNQYIVPAPLLVGESFFVQNDADGGYLYALDEDKPKSQAVAENEYLNSELMTGVIIEDMIFTGAWSLQCVDAKTLKIHWEDGEDKAFAMDHLALFASDKNILIFSQNGELLLIPAQKDKLEILGRKKISEETQGLPALSGDFFYVRDEEHVYCYRIKE